MCLSPFENIKKHIGFLMYKQQENKMQDEKNYKIHS